jgi:uncharacterized protein DUF3443
MKANPSRIFLLHGLIVASALIFGCGSASNNSSQMNQGSSSPGSNVQAISVNGGPAHNFVDGAFTSVTVCVPGSATNCQTISGILVDTGSFGLRILSSALSISLPAQNNSGGNPIAECAAFADGVTWGPVEMADVKISGEAANSIPIQVIGSPSLPNVPSSCTAQGVPMDDLSSLAANGLLGVGSSIADQEIYYACPAGGCAETTESVAEQVQNPVASFAKDNNGVIVELPAVTGAQTSINGSLIFGIGTQSNNGLAGAKVFGTNQNGDFRTTYKTTQYVSFLDSGSNGIYFLDAVTTGLPLCSGTASFLYCPTSTQTINATNNAEPGTNGASAPVSFMIGNGLTLIGSGGNAAINDLGGPAPMPGGIFDFGLPFFFGRNVYSAIVGRSTPAGTGPYLAY